MGAQPPSPGKWLFVGLMMLASFLGAWPASASVPAVGRSGLPWNAGVFTKGNASAASVTAFESWRGRPVDSILWFSTRRDWTDFDNDVPADVMAFPGIRVLALPTHPETLGWTGLEEVAAGVHNGKWQAIGAYLVRNGLNSNRTVLRIGWESNGNWYAWSATSSGAHGDRRHTFKRAWINIVDSIRAGGATQVQFNWSVNKGNQADTDAWGAYPGDAYVDILGLDIYDHWSPSFSEAQFDAEADKVPSLNDVAAYCLAHGKQMALDEWGVSHYDRGAGGGDNPFFIEQIWHWLNANADIIAYETTYDDQGAGDGPGNDGQLHHSLSPPEGTQRNPRASALYRQLWGDATQLPAPTNLTATADNAQVALSWTASNGASSYEIFRGSTPNGQSGTPTATGVMSTTYTDTGLINGATYYYKVKARHAGGLSGSSNEASATPTSSSDNTHSGMWSARGMTSATATWTSLYQIRPTTAHQGHVAKVWVKGSGNFVLKVLAGNWQTTLAETTFSASSTWTEKTISFDTGSNTQLVFYVADAGGGPGTLYVDDAFMGVDGGSNVLSNPGFESGDTGWAVNIPRWAIVQNP